MFIPAVMVAAAGAFAMLPNLLHAPKLVIGGFLAAFLVPIGLELAGVWGSTWSFAHDQMIVTSHVFHLEPVPATVFLTLATSLILVVMPLFTRAQALSLREQRSKVEIQAWHLRQLLPRTS